MEMNLKHYIIHMLKVENIEKNERVNYGFKF